MDGDRSAGEGGELGRLRGGGRPHRHVSLPLELVHDAAAHGVVVIDDQDAEQRRRPWRRGAPLDGKRLQAARQEDREAATCPRRAGHRDPAARLLDDRNAGGKTEAGPFAGPLGGEERIEDVGQDLGAHPRAIVDDVDAHVRTSSGDRVGWHVAQLDANRAGVSNT